MAILEHVHGFARPYIKLPRNQFHGPGNEYDKGYALGTTYIAYCLHEKESDISCTDSHV